MAADRQILHSDLNCFYASVEMMLNPSLRGKAVVVCSSTEDRHDIVLAKSEKAKKTGVKTGMVTWEAKQYCPELIVVPPQYDQYLKCSELVRGIYTRYTDLIEPFGMDEARCDVTDGQKSGESIAEEIRRSVRKELGMTASIGVSFNKIFAKLGSNIKKPTPSRSLPRTSPCRQVFSMIRRRSNVVNGWKLPSKTSAADLVIRLSIQWLKNARSWGP